MRDLNSRNQGSNPRPLQWKHRVLTTGPPGKSPVLPTFKNHFCLFQLSEYVGKCLEQYSAHCKCHICVRFIVGIFCSYSHIGADFTDEGLGIQTHSVWPPARCGIFLTRGRAGAGCRTPGEPRRQALLWTQSGQCLWAQLSEPMGFSRQVSWGRCGGRGSREGVGMSPNSLRTSRPAHTTLGGPRGGIGSLRLGSGELHTGHGD